MGFGHKKGADKVLITRSGPHDAASATTLLTVDVERDALDVAAVAEGHDAGGVGDQVFEINLALERDDGRAAFVAKALLEGEQVALDQAVDQAGIGQQRLQVGDTFADGSVFSLDLFALKAGELIEAHLENGVGLQFAEGVAGDQGGAGLIARGRAADQAHNLVEVIERLEESFEDVAAGFGLAQLIFGTAGDDLETVVDVAADHLLEREHLRAVVVDRQHIGAEGGLELRMFVERIEDDLADGAAFELDNDADALAGAFVADIGDAVDLLIIDHTGDIADQVGLVDHVGQLADQNIFAVFLFADLGPPANRHLAAPQLVHRLDLACAADHGTGGEVGSFDVLHQVVDGAVAVIDVVDDAGHHLVEVVGRDIGSHADGDAGRAVEEQVGDLGGEHQRLNQRLVVVGAEIDRLLVEVFQHLLGQTVHADFGITHRRRGVAIDRTEVAVTIDEEVAQREVLRHACDGIVDGLVAMGVIFTDDITDNTGRLLVGARIGVGQILHGVEDAAVNRLEAVAGVGQGATDDDAHRIVNIGGGHLLFNVDALHTGRQGGGAGGNRAFLGGGAGGLIGHTANLSVNCDRTESSVTRDNFCSIA